MLKPYEEMRKIDVTPYCEKRDGYLYLNWARCIDLLYANGAKLVDFEPIQNPKTGGSLYESETTFTNKNGVSNRCYETRILVSIDDKHWIMHAPVMNGTNPVLDNSMNQLRVWNSMVRSFVKCVAIHTGLGFDLWLKEEERTFERVPEGTNDKAPEAMKNVIKATCEKHGINLDAWLKRENTTLDKLTGAQAGLMLRAINERYGDEHNN